MSVKFYYNHKEFASLEEAEAEVEVVHNILENLPTKWCQVKEVTGSAEEGWNIPTESLTDSQILNLDPTKTYSVSATLSGDNEVGLSSADAQAKITELRTKYANYKKANAIVKVEELNPSRDMSSYV